MSEVKDKLITTESLNALHEYDENTYLKKNEALNTLGITATATELNYVDGVTSAIQTQLNNKHTIGNNVVVDKTSSPHVTLNISGNEATKIYKNASDTVDYGTTINDYDSTGKRDAFIIRRGIALENKLCLKVQNDNGEDDIYYLYGEHHKPTASEVGALSTSGGTVTGGVTFNGNVSLNGATVQTKNLYFNTNGADTGIIYAKNPSGNYVNNLQLCNENGDCIIGLGNYNRGQGDANIYGENVNIYALNSDGTTPVGTVFLGRNESNHTIINHNAILETDKTSNTYIHGSAVRVDTNNSDFTVEGIQLGKVEESTCTLSSGWEQYTDGDKTYANRYGKIVTLTGALKNTTAITSSSSKIKMFAIPSGYRPAHSVNFVCHGVGVMTWLLTIDADGAAYISRYGSSEFVDVPANEGYFVFSATYIAQ